MKGGGRGKRKDRRARKVGFFPVVSLRASTGSGIQQVLWNYLGMNEISSLQVSLGQKSRPPCSLFGSYLIGAQLIFADIMRSSLTYMCVGPGEPSLLPGPVLIQQPSTFESPR